MKKLQITYQRGNHLQILSSIISLTHAPLSNKPHPSPTWIHSVQHSRPRSKCLTQPNVVDSMTRLWISQSNFQQLIWSPSPYPNRLNLMHNHFILKNDIQAVKATPNCLIEAPLQAPVKLNYVDYKYDSEKNSAAPLHLGHPLCGRQGSFDPWKVAEKIPSELPKKLESSPHWSMQLNIVPSKPQRNPHCVNVNQWNDLLQTIPQPQQTLEYVHES